MAVITDNTKINRFDLAFGQLIKENIRDGQTALAEKTLKAFAVLPPDSKVRLYDFLTIGVSE